MKFLLTLYTLLLINTLIAQQKVYINFNYINVQTGTIENFNTLVVDNKGNSKIYSRYISNIDAIDLQGKFIMPTLYDMHIHWPDTLISSFTTIWQNAGIGNIRVMKSNVHTINDINISGQNKINYAVGFPFYSSTVVLKTKKFIDSIKKQGYQFIKFFSVANQDLFVQIANAAKKAKLGICGHALNNVSIDVAFENGYSSVEHCGYIDKLWGNGLDSAITKFKNYNVAVCPTLDWMLIAYGVTSKDALISRNEKAKNLENLQAFWENKYQSPEQNFGKNVEKMKQNALAQLEKKLMILKKLDSAGVSIIAGSDAEEAYQAPGYSLIEELKHIAKAGISNQKILQMATINAEIYWQKLTQKSAPKKFILLNENPLENLDALYTAKPILLK